MFFEMISGFLFWLVIIAVMSGVKFGYEIFSDLDAEAKLQRINDDPEKFRTSVTLILLEHVSIIALAITLFIAFSPYNLTLAVVWTVSRIVEALIQIYNKKNYWRLLDIARQYSETNGVEQRRLVDSGRSILKSKNSSFCFAQVLFSVGTLAYSILFVTYEGVPALIGWFGVVASIIYGAGNGMKLVRPDVSVLWNVGGLFIWIYEIVIGGWLLFSPLI